MRDIALRILLCVGALAARPVLAHEPHGLADQLAAKLSAAMGDQVRELQELVAQEELSRAIAASNDRLAALPDRDAHIEQADLEWKFRMGGDSDALVDAVLHDAASDRLSAELADRASRERLWPFAEAFLTDRYGCVVAMTNATTDYLQADEGWWSNARTHGAWIDYTAFDMSAGQSSAVMFCLRIDLPDGGFAGVFKGATDASRLQRLIDREIHPHPTTMAVWLVDSNGGLVLSSTGSTTAPAAQDVKRFYEAAAQPVASGERRAPLEAAVFSRDAAPVDWDAASLHGVADGKWMLFVLKQSGSADPSHH